MGPKTHDKTEQITDQLNNRKLRAYIKLLEYISVFVICQNPTIYLHLVNIVRHVESATLTPWQYLIQN